VTYARELDELRREVRKDVATTLKFWPKIDGANVIAEDTGSVNVFTVYDSNGAVLQASTAATVTDIGSPDEYSYLTLSIPAISTLQEDCTVQITWYQDTIATAHFDVISFDVVLYPLGGPSVSLNDLLEERPDCGEVLDRLGVLLGYTTGDAAKKGMAAVVAYRGLIELDGKIRNAVAKSQNSDVPSYTSTLTSGTPIYTRPYLILNRERLNAVERKCALKALYAADMSEPEGDDESAALYRFYAQEAETAWRGVGPLKYDSVEDLVPDTELTGLNRCVSLRRRW
jgi:hypothetical protein